MLLNYSGPDLDPYDYLFSDSELTKYCMIIFITAAAIFGTISNCLMIHTYVCLCRGDQRKKYLIGVAFAALTLSVLYYPLFIVELICPDITIKHKEICLLTKCVKIFVVVFFNFSATVVSFWNYIFFVYPLKGRLWMKASRIVLIWIVAFLVSVVIVVAAYFVNFASNASSGKVSRKIIFSDIEDTFSIGAVLFPSFFTSTSLTIYVQRLAYQAKRRRKPILNDSRLSIFKGPRKSRRC